MDTVAVGTNLFRIHRTKFDPAHFGRAASHRFDCPDGSYGVLYCGLSEEVAFAETFLRGSEPLVAISELEVRSLSIISLVRPLRLVRLFGPGLSATGATASTTSGRYAISQAWSKNLHSHGDAADGILYRSTSDNDEMAIALFDRAAASIRIRKTSTLLGDAVRLGRILDRYGAALR
jgi:hypothetical protein